MYSVIICKKSTFLVYKKNITKAIFFYLKTQKRLTTMLEECKSGHMEADNMVAMETKELGSLKTRGRGKTPKRKSRGNLLVVCCNLNRL